MQQRLLHPNIGAAATLLFLTCRGRSGQPRLPGRIADSLPREPLLRPRYGRTVWQGVPCQLPYQITISKLAAITTSQFEQLTLSRHGGSCADAPVLPSRIRPQSRLSRRSNINEFVAGLIQVLYKYCLRPQLRQTDFATQHSCALTDTHYHTDMCAASQIVASQVLYRAEFNTLRAWFDVLSRGNRCEGGGHLCEKGTTRNGPREQCRAAKKT